MTKRPILIAFVCFLVVVAIVVTTTWTPLRIAYHKHTLERVHKRIYSKPTTTSGGLAGYGSSKLFEKQDYHCRRLAALGYFFHKRYEMENLPDTGEVSSAFWRLVQEEFPDRRYPSLSYPDNVLEVWDLTEHESKWDTFVRKYNVVDFADQFMHNGPEETEPVQEGEAVHPTP